MQRLWMTMTIMALMIMVGSCTPAPLCGNGTVEEGETAATCCEDVACEVGVCAPSHRCELPWEATCATEGCVDDGPLLCSNDAAAPPTADCAACGCPSNGACLQGVCVTPAVRDQARDDDAVSDLLDDEDYVALLRLITRAPAQTIAQVRDQLDARRLVDPRRITRIIGTDALDGDVGAAQLADGSSLDDTQSTCAQLQAQTGLYPEVRQQLSLPIAQVDDVTCLYPGQFSQCVLPLAAGCVAAAGRHAERLLVVGAAAYDAVDDGLLRHAVRSSKNQWLVRLDDVAALHRDAAAVINDERFRDDDSGRLVRVIADATDGVWWVHAPPVDDQPHRTLSFRALWADAQLRAFMDGEDMLPTDCRFDVRAEAASIEVECARGGARVSATLTLDHLIVESSTEGA